MKMYSKILIGFFVLGFLVQTAFGQSKKSMDSVFIKTQIRPKFSEMVDYGLPVNKETKDVMPGGKFSVPSEINPDGTNMNNRSEEIIVPAGVKTTKNYKTPKAHSDSKMKIRKKKD